MRGAKSNNEKNQPKKYTFETIKGKNGSEKLKFSKDISITPIKSTYQIILSSSLEKGDKGRTSPFQGNKKASRSDAFFLSPR